MNSVDSQETIENDNLNLFPTSFPFFDYVISHPPAFIYLSNFIYFLSILQQYYSVFLPLLIPLLLDNSDNVFFKSTKSIKDTFFLKAVLYFTQHTDKFPNFLTYDSRLIFYFLPSFIIILINLFFFVTFHQSDEISSFICQIRCFLFIFMPSMSIFPIVLRFSFALKSFFSDEEINTTVITCEIILAISFLLILILFTSWSSPMIYQSPIFGKGQIPSHLITDPSFFTRTQIVDIINICLCIIGGTDLSLFIYFAIAIINAIFKIHYVVNYPFLSIFHSAIICSASFSNLICLSIFLFQILNNWFSEVFFMLSSIILFIASFIFFYYYLIISEKKRIQIIASKEYEKISPSLIPTYFQVAVINGILSPRFIEFITSNYPETNSPQYLITLLISEKINLNTFCEMIPSILNIDDLTYAQKYLVYQIYIKYMRNSDKEIEFQGLNEIENRLESYNQTSDEFWALMLLGKTNKALKLAHNNEFKLTQLLKDYNLYYQACPHNQQVNMLHQRFFYNFVKKPMNSDVFYHSATESDDSILSSGASSQYMQISYNLKKALDQHIPIFLLLFRFIGFICFIFFLTASMFPIFQLSRDSSVLLNLSPALNHSLNIALLFSKMNLATGNAISCTDYLSMSCQDILSNLHAKNPEPNNAHCHSISYFYDHLLQFSDDLLARLNAMTNQFNNLPQNQYLMELKNSWSKRSLTLFPNSNNDSIRSIKVDIKSALLLFAGQIKENPLFDSPHRCDSSFVDVIRQDAIEISNRSSQVQININNSLQHYNDYMKTLAGSGARFFSPTEIIFMIIFGIGSLLIPFLSALLNNKRSYTLLNKYFRPSSHPSPSFSHLEISETVEPLKYNRSYRVLIYTWMSVIIATICIAYLVSNLLSPAYDFMMNESQMLICMERLASYCSLIAETIMRHWVFPANEEVSYYYNYLKKDIHSSMNEFYNSMSPELIQHFRRNAMPEIINNQCEALTSRSTHDIYSCWNFILQSELYFFLFETHNITSITKDIFLHISHLYMTHISNGFIQIGDLFTRYSLQTHESFLAVLIFGLIIYFAIVIIAFSITLSEVYKLLHIQRQISRFFMVLPPVYVAQNNCLMDYVTDIDEKANKAIADTYISLYENSDIALILINDRLSITSFTQAALHLFSYRAEQLIGQQIDLLFPKDIESNDIKFFQHISIVLKKQAENTFTRTLVGRLSYGEESMFKVKITGFYLNEDDENSLYFVLECTSQYGLYYYDEMIQNHTDVFNEMFQYSVPISLFNNSTQRENGILVKNFTRFCMAYVFTQVPDDPEGLRNQLCNTLSYLNGNDGGLVYYYTNSTCLAIFIDENPNYLFHAYQFFKSFGKNCCGFIVEGTDIDLVFFPQPPIPDEYNGSEMPIEITQQYQPSMTIEPITKMMMNVPALARLCKKGKLICTEGLMQFYLDTKYQIIDNTLELGLYMVDT